MGVAGSTAKVCNLTQQELDGFVGTSHFSAAEVKALWVQFASLGKADGGSAAASACGARAASRLRG